MAQELGHTAFSDASIRVMYSAPNSFVDLATGLSNAHHLGILVFPTRKGYAFRVRQAPSCPGPQGRAGNFRTSCSPVLPGYMKYWHQITGMSA